MAIPHGLTPRHRAIVLAASAAAVVLCCAAAWLYARGRNASREPVPASGAQAGAPADDPDVVEIPKQVAALNHMAIATAERPTRSRQLELRGSLATNPDTQVHVHARFPGQVVEVAPADDARERAEGVTGPRRALGFMDRVKKGQPLAILWSKDLGEKKSELVDILARLQIDRESLDRIKRTEVGGAATQREVRDAELKVQLDEIAAERVKRTLRSWELSEADILKVEEEVKRVSQHREGNRQEDAEWARVKITTPIDGTIVEKNFTIGDLVDTTSDLFKIADLSVLNVWLHAYEEDLPALERLPRPIPITIRLPANPEIGELSASIDRIGDIIDPNEHMALLIGQIANPRGDLRIGQFVTARLQLGPDEDVVEIPTRALAEDGNESLVFVQQGADELRFKQRRVSVARRFYDVVLIRSRLTPEQKADGLEELHEGDRVAASETVQLKAALRQKQLTTGVSPAEPTEAPRKTSAESPAQPSAKASSAAQP